RPQVSLPRRLGDAMEKMTVPGMDAVEIPDGESRRAETGSFLDTPSDSHSAFRLHFDFEPVVGQPYVRRQRSFGSLVMKVVADMRGKGALRAQFLDPFEAPTAGGLSRIRSGTQCCG